MSFNSSACDPCNLAKYLTENMEILKHNLFIHKYRNNFTCHKNANLKHISDSVVVPYPSYAGKVQSMDLSENCYLIDIDSFLKRQGVVNRYCNCCSILKTHHKTKEKDLPPELCNIQNTYLNPCFDVGRFRI